MLHAIYRGRDPQLHDTTNAGLALGGDGLPDFVITLTGLRTGQVVRNVSLTGSGGNRWVKNANGLNAVLDFVRDPADDTRGTVYFTTAPPSGDAGIFAVQVTYVGDPGNGDHAQVVMYDERISALGG